MNEDIRRIIDERPGAAFRAALTIALREAKIKPEAVVYDDVLPAMAWTGHPDRRIRVPHPTSASRTATALHEALHQKLHRGKGPDDIGWLGEAAVCKHVLALWDELHLPDKDQAAYSLGEALSGYLRRAIQDGTTMDAIDEIVPDELLPYKRRLEALAQSVATERRRSAGAYIERRSPEPVW